MGRQSVQQQEAIPLLHDGPLLSQVENLDSSAGPAALFLRQTLTETLELSSTSSICADFLRNLSAARRIKDQLATLQAFKSTIIQKNRMKKTSTGNNSSQDGFVEVDWSELEYVYHILLDWSLGYQTPSPLRRTIHSILEAVYEIHPSRSSLESTFVRVLDSISVDGSIWHEPLDSLDALLSLALIRPIRYREDLIGPAISFLCRKAQSITAQLQSNNDDVASIEQGVKAALLAKAILQDDKVLIETDLTAVARLCWDLLQHPLTPADSLPVAGMAYSRAVTFANKPKECLVCLHSYVEQAHRELQPLSQVCALQGLAARVPDDVWILPTESTDACRIFQSFFGETVRHAMDPEVRLAALKGTRTLVSRSITLLGSYSIDNHSSHLSVMRDVSEYVLELVLQAWENPPTRKLASSIPLLFQAVIDWKENLAKRLDSDSDLSTLSMDILVDRLLAQPPYRKGKYKALECLLAKVGAERILKMKADDPSGGLLSDLLTGVADASHNTGVMADLWAKLLKSFFTDMHEIPDAASKKKIKKKSETTPSNTPMLVSTKWLDAWVPSLANALVSTEWKRRKQVAAFCLARVLPMVSENVDAAAQSFAALLDCVSGKLSNEVAEEAYTIEREGSRDRTLWAMMEIIRYSAIELNFGGNRICGSNDVIVKAIVANISIDRLCQGLRHFSSTIRVTSFQAMEGILCCILETPMECCICEVDLWKATLSYAAKADPKEYLSILFHRLLSFLDRLSKCESSEIGIEGTDSSGILPIFGNFVNDFLLGEMVQYVTYPDSVVAKETFGLSLLESIIVFSCRDLDIAFESRLLPKTGAMYERRRSAAEEQTLKGVRSKLTSPTVVGSLLSLLHSSSWEGSKAKAFEILSSLIIMARHERLSLPERFFESSSLSRTEESALKLASSPRPREADTGARVLAILGLSRESFRQRMQFVEHLVKLLEERLKELKIALGFVLKPDIDIRLGREVPLVHGIIRALRLIIESRAFEIPRCASLLILDNLSKTLCNAMQVSLAVVGDVRDGENLEGTEDDCVMVALTGDDPTKGKINPGAIGANGIFSSIKRVDEIEYERRLASQRIIVGSWLLTKETCAAVASVLTTVGYKPPQTISNSAGTLLISTLTSLKHTGAAYAAHSALQKIVKATLDSSDHSCLPIHWVDRLLREITSIDKIRDSTLRRSTGYALGFLSVMRAEIVLRSVPRSICLNVTHRILSLTLPPPSRLRDFLSTVGLPPEDHLQIFSYLNEEDLVNHLHTHSTRSRVHSLNVLRMMILDAPLSQDVFPLVGDAIVSAIMGYVDSEWSVRNSAGMVFSACMLRVVDADKNAANTDTTSKNAISFSELFQSYPALCGVLLAVLAASISGKLKVDGGGSLPPILPILVLLYRAQPLHNCDPDMVKKMQSFCPSVSACLGHPHLSVRQAAARALCNLRGRGNGSALAVESLHSNCFRTIRSSADWNVIHGSILLLKEIWSAKRSEHESIATHPDVNVLLDLMETSDRGLAAPPLCIMDSIQAVESVGDMEGLQHQLVGSCLGLIDWISQDTKNRLEIAGISELCTTLSNAAIKLATKKAFQNREPEQLTRLVDEFSCLLESDIFDVRVAAAKAFKKVIYNCVDSLKCDSLQELNWSTKILRTVSEAVKAALAKELSRDSSKGGICLGTHPPTLRRLSRCLLELNEALRLVRNDSNMRSDHGLRELGLAILDREHLETEYTTPLVGNAVELLAEGLLDEDAKVLLPLLENLSSAAQPWRLRYSVACTVAALWQDQIGLRIHLRHLVSRLLQDEDPDARYTVVKALTDGRASGLPVPEYVLVNFIQNQETTQHHARSFVALLLHRAKKLMAQLVPEQSTPTTQRKIFEVEDPNSYHEPALSDQATLWSLWEILAADPSLSSQQQQLSTLAGQIVLILSEQSHADVLIRTHFTDIHTLLLATTSAPKDAALTDAAWCFLSKLTDTPLHPSLESVLRLLVERRSEGLTREQIQPFCFLLNRGVTTF